MPDRSTDAAQPPIGMRPDGTLNALEPGAPIPQPVVLTADGEELTPSDFDEQGERVEDDLSDLDDPLPEA